MLPKLKLHQESTGICRSLRHLSLAVGADVCELLVFARLFLFPEIQADTVVLISGCGATERVSHETGNARNFCV